MSNYRVRQVLALGHMPERQLRLLIALATWMSDDSRTVKVGFDTLIETSGNVRNTVRAARRDLQTAGKLTWKSRPGRGHLTYWTLLCLPEKGVNDADPISEDEGAIKGVNDPPEKGSTTPEKRGQPQLADQGTSDHGLNRVAKPFPGAAANGAGAPSPGEDPRPARADPDHVAATIASLRQQMGWPA